MKILSKREKDKVIYSYYKNLINSGRSIMEATYATMEQFGISSTVTVINIRKRMEGVYDN